MRQYVRQPADERFWKFVKPNECWEWTGFIYPNGYGLFFRGNHRSDKMYAHRWAYEHYVGTIPEGLQIDHLCRNRRCVNPLHLEPVTPHVNSLRAQKSACMYGHPFDEKNTYRPKKAMTQRKCRECHRIGEIQRRNARLTA